VTLGCGLNWLGIAVDRISRSAPSVSAIVVYFYLVEFLTLRMCPSTTRRRVFRQRILSTSVSASEIRTSLADSQHN
jgi:hypothetical protein